MDEGDGSPGEGLVGRLHVEGLPGVHAVDGHPAQEEQHHDHHQHANHSLLGLELGLRCVTARALHLRPAPSGHTPGSG